MPPPNSHRSSMSRRPQSSLSNRPQSSLLNRPQSLSLSRRHSSLSNRPASSLSTNPRSSSISYRTAASHMVGSYEERFLSSLEHEINDDVDDDSRVERDEAGDRQMIMHEEDDGDRGIYDLQEEDDIRMLNRRQNEAHRIDEEDSGRTIEGNEDDEDDGSSQEDSFDWTSSESGSPDEQRARPPSPQAWPLREQPATSTSSQLELQTPVPPQSTFAPKSSSAGPSTQLSPPRCVHSDIPQSTSPFSFVPDASVFPTVAITPETGFAQPRGNFLAQSFKMHIDGPIVTHEEPQLHQWIPLPLSGALGMQLWFSPWAVYKNLYEYNYFIRILSIDPDFERLRREWGRIGDGWIQPVSFKGGAILVLENGRVLEEKQVEALSTYIDAFLPEVVQFFRGGVRTLNQLDQASEASKEKLSPLAFAEFWFKYSRRRADITGDKTWLRVECPVDEKMWKDSIDLNRLN